MSKRLVLPALAQFVAATAGRNMTKAAYAAVDGRRRRDGGCSRSPPPMRRRIAGSMRCCGHASAYFVFEWAGAAAPRRASASAAVGLRAVRPRAGRRRRRRSPCRSRSLSGVEPKTAWLLGVLWVLKVVPGIPGLRQLRRVLVQESGPLFSVLVIFLMVVFLASVAEYFLERDVQPATFGSVPAALWWAVVTLTTTGYGDVVPITPLGRMVAALVMISGLGVFGLWTGILATGFAAETRRDNFLKTWESVSKVPFFADARPRGDRRRHPHAAHHGPAGAHHDHPQGPAGRLHVFHRRRRGRGRSARQEGAARRRRVLRRDGAARQQSARRQYHDHAAVEAAGARPRRLPPADGAASGSRRDHRRRSQAARAREQSNK